MPALTHAPVRVLRRRRHPPANVDLHHLDGATLGRVHSSGSSSTLPPPIVRPKEDSDSGDGAELYPDQTPSNAAAKPPLSVVDSEELKRKGHSLSLLSPEREAGEGARARATLTSQPHLSGGGGASPGGLALHRRRTRTHYPRCSCHRSRAHPPPRDHAGVQNRDPGSPTELGGGLNGSPKRSRSGRPTTSAFATAGAHSPSPALRTTTTGA